MRSLTTQSVLIHSAAGGVGIAAIQISQYVGAEVSFTGLVDFVSLCLLMKNLDICYGWH